jgi:hypothetical protein
MSKASYKEILMVKPYADGSGKSQWTRIGTGFVNDSGSISLKFDAFPTNLSKERDDGGAGLMLVDPKPREESGSDGFE